VPTTPTLDNDAFKLLGTGASLCTAARMVWDAEDLSRWRRERRDWVERTIDVLEELDDDTEAVTRQFRLATNLPRSSGDPFKDLFAEEERVREGMAVLATLPH
jgi:hypothetical protein